MNEKSRETEGNPETDLDYLRKQLEAAEAEVTEAKGERDRIMDAILGESGEAAGNFKRYLECKEKIKQAEEKAIKALEAWGDAAARRFNLKD